MKRTSAAIVMALFAGSAHAVTPAEGCKSYQDAAEGVMQIRQIGMSPEFIYDRAENAGVDMTPIFRRMVTTAYEVPKYDTESRWNRAIQGHGDKWYALCRENWDGVTDSGATSDGG